MLKHICLSLLLLAIVLVVAFAENRYTGSDPRASLLVSESLINNRSLKLDDYGESTLSEYGYVIHKKNQHYYYFFPLGTSLVSVPFVAVANVFGYSMSQFEGQTQIVIASVVAMLTFLYLYKTARFFLTDCNALLIAAIFWFGTAFSSVGGTALWSHNFAAFFALISIYLSLNFVLTDARGNWCLIALSLFLAYLCRPTLALLSPFLLLFLFSYSRIFAIKAGFFLVVLLGFFSLFSMHEFGQWLPDYYLPKRLNSSNIYPALYGNLLSPSRGLLVFSPFLAFVWLCFNCRNRDYYLKKSWVLIGLAWPILHLYFISRFEHWWGGMSYGPRLMMDALPGLFLLTIYVWPAHLKYYKSKASVFILSLTCVFSILVNAGQGLFNQYTMLWNGNPSVDQYPEYLFDWEYPQFLASAKGHEQRLRRHAKKLDEMRSVGVTVDYVSEHYHSDGISFRGWYAPEIAHRWTEGNEAEIYFNINTLEKMTGVLVLRIATLGHQRITIYLNDKKIYFDDLIGWDLSVEAKFDPSLLKEKKNTLLFELPDARQPGNGDPRILGMALKTMKIE